MYRNMQYRYIIHFYLYRTLYLTHILIFHQLRQSHLELQEVQMSHRQLSTRLEELSEEQSLQGLTPHPSSLLYEIEQSMEQEEQEQEREQVNHATVHI